MNVRPTGIIGRMWYTRCIVCGDDCDGGCGCAIDVLVDVAGSRLDVTEGMTAELAQHIADLHNAWLEANNDN